MSPETRLWNQALPDARDRVAQASRQQRAKAMTHVLFVCSKNQLRSPTAEQLFSCWPGIEVASAGTDPKADQPLSPELLQWADLIFLMEASHRRKLKARFSRHIKQQRLIVLNIADDYQFMEPALIDILKQRVIGHLPPAR